MDLLSGASIQRLESALSASSMRQKVLQNNVANVDTPNFKRSDVQFEELLSQTMGNSGTASIAGVRTDPRHLAIGASSGSLPSAQVTTDESTMINNSRNNVDIDKEMSLLAKNQLRYNLYITQMNHDVKMMRIGMGK